MNSSQTQTETDNSTVKKPTSIELFPLQINEVQSLRPASIGTNRSITAYVPRLPHTPLDPPPTTSPAIEHVRSIPSRGNKVSKAKGITVIITLAGINFLNTIGSSVLIAALPRIAQDVGLSQGLILWPAAVYALATGCLLLIFGAVADVMGPKLNEREEVRNLLTQKNAGSQCRKTNGRLRERHYSKVDMILSFREMS